MRAVYTMPVDTGWQLVVSRKAGQWGIPYPAGQDFGRAPMKVGKTAKNIEQLTFAIDDTPPARRCASSGARRARAFRSRSDKDARGLAGC
jgi:hypothetical protein